MFKTVGLYRSDPFFAFEIPVCLATFSVRTGSSELQRIYDQLSQAIENTRETQLNAT